jgi:hypothetical protein
MKEHAAGGRVRRSRSAPSDPMPAPLPADLPMPIDAAHRNRLIAEVAYYRAEARGFSASGILDDWLAAEREIDRLLLNDTAPRRKRRRRQER